MQRLTIIQAIVLVLLILGLMAGLRVAMVTAMSIPLIMLTAVALMRIWDVEIEQISLAALIVALGLLVDNAIVTCENTTNSLNKGMPKKDAVVEGCNSVGSSLLWSTLTTISVFIPMTFAEICDRNLTRPDGSHFTLSRMWSSSPGLMDFVTGKSKRLSLPQTSVSDRFELLMAIRSLKSR